MTRIAPASGEPLDATPRASMHTARRARILHRQDGRCARLGCDHPATEIDHVIPLALGGREDDANVEGLCAEHHRAKTALDLRLIAKARRCHFKHAGGKKPTAGRLKGRGFARWSPPPIPGEGA